MIFRRSMVRELTATVFTKEKIAARLSELEEATKEARDRETKAVAARRENTGGFGGFPGGPGGQQPPPDLPSTVNYLLPFHMLAAGPIQAYDDFVRQPGAPPAPDTATSLTAVGRIASGLFTSSPV